MKKIILILLFSLFYLTFIFSKNLKVDVELLFDEKYYGFKIDTFYIVIEKNEFYLFKEHQVWKIATLDFSEKEKKFLFMKYINAFVDIYVLEKKRIIRIIITIVSNRKKLIVVKKYNLDDFFDYYLLKEN